MSIKYLARVLGGLEVTGDTHVSADRVRLVLARLADHANDDGLCWPSGESIGIAVGIPRWAVTKALSALIDQKLIEPVGERSKGGVTTRYHLRFGEPMAHAISSTNGTDGTRHQSTDGTRHQLNGDEPMAHASEPMAHASPTDGVRHQEPPEPPRTVKVSGGGRDAPAGAVAPAHDEAGEEEQILDAILAAVPATGINGARLLSDITKALGQGVEAERIISSATQPAPRDVKNWTGLLSKRIKEARWYRPGDPVSAEPTSTVAADDSLIEEFDALYEKLIDAHKYREFEDNASEHLDIDSDDDEWFDKGTDSVKRSAIDLARIVLADRGHTDLIDTFYDHSEAITALECRLPPMKRQYTSDLCRDLDGMGLDSRGHLDGHLEEATRKTMERVVYVAGHHKRRAEQAIRVAGAAPDTNSDAS